MAKVKHSEDAGHEDQEQTPESGPEEGKIFGYFRRSDGVSFDRSRQLYEAKARAIGMANATATRKRFRVSRTIAAIDIPAWPP